MADVKLSGLDTVEKLVDGLRIPVSVKVGENKWQSKALITSANDLSDYAYAGVLSHLAKGTGIDIAEANGVYTINNTLDTEVFVFVEELPTENINTNKIYLVPGGAAGDDQNKLIEYVRVENRWEKIGEQHAAVDFTEVNNKIAEKYVKPEGGITADDLSSAVQASLGKANTALQSADLMISDSYVEHKDSKEETVLGVAHGDTYEAAFAKLEKAILDNENVDATAITAIASAVGLDNNLKYSIGEEGNKLESVSAAIDKLFEEVAKKQDKATEGEAYATESWVEGKNYLVAENIIGKQDVIDDLDDIRSGAAAGATAVQPDAVEALTAKVVELERILAQYDARFARSEDEDKKAIWGKEFLVIESDTEEETHSTEE